MNQPASNHSSSTCRVLTPDDADAATRLWHLRAKIMRSPSSTVPSFEGGTVLGAFHEKELISTLRIADLPDFPAYVIYDLYTKPSYMPLYYFEPGHPVCNLFDMAVELKEADGMYEWYYTRAMSPAYVKAQQDGKDLLSSTRLGGRYDRFVAEIVKSGGVSRWKTHNVLMKNRKYDHDVLIAKCLLRNEHRPIGTAFLRPHAE